MKGNLQSTKGIGSGKIECNFGGKIGRSLPSCILQSIGFKPAASTFISTSSSLGLGTGTSEFCNQLCISWMNTFQVCG